MSTLHPHWQTTDEDESAVRVTDKNAPAPVTPANGIPRAKRGPAAFIGIALFIGIGIALFRGVGTLSGQLSGSPDDRVILLTDSGPNPPELTVQPGEKIRWDNGSTIPHILESDTLPTADDKPFASTAIFPNASYEYIVPAGSPDGSHTYASRTAASVTGTITIQTTQEPAPATPEIPAQEEPMPETPAEEPALTTQEPAFTDTQSPPVAETVTPGSIPRNPYTVAGGSMPLPGRPLHNPTPAAPQANVTQHVPLSNATTGMGVWVTLGLIGVSVLFVTRRAVRVL